MKQTRSCLCGNTKLKPFSPDYLRCVNCEALVVREAPAPATLLVQEDETGFYGRPYFESYQTECLGLPSIEERSRTDLPERCLHWLRTLLKYKQPPARVLELGSSHGGFVALLRWSGFDATGLDLSPWVADFARRTFDVPMLVGPLEAQHLESKSLDALVLMDVLEHLPDPAGTMERGLNLLKEDGILLIQTPCYPEGATFQELQARQDAFLKMMLPEQHLHLLSRKSIGSMLEKLGAGHIKFESAIFSDYDMFVVASRVPLVESPREEVEARLAAPPGSRLARLLLDMDDRHKALLSQYGESEADRAARLEQIEAQGRHLQELDRNRNEVELRAAELRTQTQQLEAERAGLAARLRDLEQALAASDADRAARLEQIEAQGRHLQELDRNRNEAEARTAELRTQAQQLEAERAGLAARLRDLEQALAVSDADRSARLEQIETQGHHLQELDRNWNEAEARAAELRTQAQQLEAERTALVARLRDLEQALAVSEATNTERLEQIEAQGRHLLELDRSRNEAEALAAELRAEVERLSSERTILTAQVHRIDADRLACHQRLQAQERHLAELARIRTEAGERVAELRIALDGLKDERAVLTARLEDSERALAESDADCKSRMAEIEKRISEVTRLGASLIEAEQRVAKLEGELKRTEEQRATSAERLQEVEKSLAESDADRAARLAVIERQGRQLIELDRIRTDLEQQHMFAQQLLERIHQTLAYRFLRGLGLWSWVKPQAPLVAAPAEPLPQLPPRKAGLNCVAIDLTPVLPGGENGGAKLMTLDLIRNFSALAPECNFILLTSSRAHEELATLDADNVHRLCVNAQEVNPPKAAPSGFLTRLHRRLSRVLPAPAMKRLESSYRAVAERARGNSLVRELGADLLFCPFTAPFYYDPTVPAVSVVYDLQYLHYPEFFDDEVRSDRDRHFRQACKAASRLVTISDYVRDTVVAAGGVPPERVVTAHIALQHRLKPQPETDVQRVLARYGLTAGRYLLYPANFWLHKNHEALMTAFGMYCARHSDSNLVLVLPGTPGPRQEGVRQASECMGLGQRTIFPGYIPDEDLSALLSGCLAMIFPSLYEGFGIPVLEAMAAGKPVLCSNVTSLPEIAGEAALFFDPRKPQEIAEAIARIAGDPELAATLAAKGRERADLFAGPREMAEAYLNIFREVLEKPRSLTWGMYGIYADNWSEDRIVVTYPPGPEFRKVVLEFSIPDWILSEYMWLTVMPYGDHPLDVQVVGRGQRSVLDLPLPPDSGSIEVLCRPTACPAELGIGADTRSLGLKLHSGRMVLPDGRSEPLPLTNNGS